MLVFERLLAVIVALRLHLGGVADRRPEVLAGDYEDLRALLTCLPLVPEDRDLSPQTLVTARAVFEELNKSGGEELSGRYKALAKYEIGTARRRSGGGHELPAALTFQAEAGSDVVRSVRYEVWRNKEGKWVITGGTR